MLLNTAFKDLAQISLKKLYGDIALSDVTLVSQDGVLFSVHKTVLASASEQLKEALLRNQPSHLLYIEQSTEDLYLQGPKQVGPEQPETFFKNS